MEQPSKPRVPCEPLYRHRVLGQVPLWIRVGPEQKPRHKDGRSHLNWSYHCYQALQNPHSVRVIQRTRTTADSFSAPENLAQLTSNNSCMADDLWIRKKDTILNVVLCQSTSPRYAPLSKNELFCPLSRFRVVSIAHYQPQGDFTKRAFICCCMPFH